MELDDLKKDWEYINSHNSDRNTLTPEIIDQMTEKKYNTEINKIKYAELSGILVCFTAVIFIGFNFNKLDTIIFQSTGVLTIIILAAIPVSSFLSLRKLNSRHNFNRPHIDMIQQFMNNKILFHQYQKTNALLCYFLLVGTTLLLPKIFYDKDITSYKTFWTFAFALGYIFLLVFSKWVTKFYSNSINQAERLIKEIRETKTSL